MKCGWIYDLVKESLNSTIIIIDLLSRGLGAQPQEAVEFFMLYSAKYLKHFKLLLARVGVT